MTTPVLAVPTWVTVLRGFQLFLCLIVLGISCYGVYWIAFNSWAFAIFTSLYTLIIVIYGIVTSRVKACSVAYNHWAVVALDAAAVIFWLSSMGALAATRASFTIDTVLSGCGHDGSIGGGYCFKRSLAPRNVYVATDSYLAMMSAAAGISAIIFILFIITLVMSSIALHKSRMASKTAAAPPTNDKLEEHPMQAVPEQQQQYQQPPPPANYQQPPPPANYQEAPAGYHH